MTEARKEGRIFDLTLTGELSLDLVNTLDWRASGSPKELLSSYGDLLRWSRHTGLLTEAEARRLGAAAARRPGEARAVLKRAVDLREVLFRIFREIAAARRPDRRDDDEFSAGLAEALSRLRLKPAGLGYAWDWDVADDRLDRMLLPVARAAAELLTSESLGRLRACPGAGCGWLFLDTSRNRSRRWCSMEICGNRAKARRHYRQLRSDD